MLEANKSETSFWGKFMLPHLTSNEDTQERETRADYPTNQSNCSDLSVLQSRYMRLWFARSSDAFSFQHVPTQLLSLGLIQASMMQTKWELYHLNLREDALKQCTSNNTVHAAQQAAVGAIAASQIAFNSTAATGMCILTVKW